MGYTVTNEGEKQQEANKYFTIVKANNNNNNNNEKEKR